MVKLFWLDILVYNVTAFAVMAILALVLKVPQWAIDAVTLGIILSAINGNNRFIVNSQKKETKSQENVASEENASVYAGGFMEK